MAVGYKKSDGTDLDDIFEPHDGGTTQTTGYQDSSGTDLGSRYMAYSDGAGSQTAANTGYQLSNGSDIAGMFTVLGDTYQPAVSGWEQITTLAGTVGYGVDNITGGGITQTADILYVFQDTSFGSVPLESDVPPYDFNPSYSHGTSLGDTYYGYFITNQDPSLSRRYVMLGGGNQSYYIGAINDNSSQVNNPFSFSFPDTVNPNMPNYPSNVNSVSFIENGYLYCFATVGASLDPVNHYVKTSDTVDNVIDRVSGNLVSRAFGMLSSVFTQNIENISVCSTGQYFVFIIKDDSDGSHYLCRTPVPSAGQDISSLSVTNSIPETSASKVVSDRNGNVLALAGPTNGVKFYISTDHGATWSSYTPNMNGANFSYITYKQQFFMSHDGNCIIPFYATNTSTSYIATTSDITSNTWRTDSTISLGWGNSNDELFYDKGRFYLCNPNEIIRSIPA